MRIDRLTVRNFRCFQEREFVFQPQFNVLIGENGTGKTAVLEALAVAAGSWLLGIGRAASRQIRPDDVRLIGREVGDEFEFHEQFPVQIAADGWVCGQQLGWSRTVRGSGGRTTYGEAQNLRHLGFETQNAILTGQAVTLPLIAYYGTGRLWLQPRDTEARQAATKQELSRFEAYRDSIDDRVSPRELTRWLERQDRIAYQERRATTVYTAVREAMRRMVEGARDVRFDNRRLEVVVEFEDGEIRPFGQLSDGQRNMLALAGDIAMRTVRLNPEMKSGALEQTPGLVLIDELDLHLHPTWQRHVVEDLRSLFPMIQFIATTHSPFVVQTLREGELLPLDAQPVPEVANLGIEEIARGLMGVERPEVSPRYHLMVDTAKTYLATLDEAAKAPADKQAEFRDALAAQVAPFADNPAYQAFLEMERVARLGA